MKMEQIRDRVETFVLHTFPLAKQRQCCGSDNLIESGIVDSLGILDLVGFIEKDFGIEVLDDELVPSNFRSIDELTAFVLSKHVLMKSKEPVPRVELS